MESRKIKQRTPKEIAKAVIRVRLLCLAKLRIANFKRNKADPPSRKIQKKWIL